MPDFVRRTALCVTLCGSLAAAAAAHAQAPALPLDRPGERELPVPERESAPPPALALPPSEPPARASAPGLRVRLRAVRFVGNTAFSDEELTQVVAGYIGRDIDAEDLEAMRLALTRHYLEHGYINSGAVVPDQPVTDGTITLRLVEGRLTDIEISGSRRLPEAYVRERVQLGAGVPLDVTAIRDRLYLLQQDPRIARVDAALLPGRRPGEARLHLDVEEAPSRALYVGADNHRSPSVGATRGEFEYLDRNLLGRGDTLALRYGLTRGLDDIDVDYAFPLNARDTALTLRYARSDSTVIEAPFDILDIESETETAALGIWHPYVKTPRKEYAVGLTVERRRNQTFLLGQPFAFSAGADADGITRVTVYRLLASWLAHAPARVVAARSTLSYGSGALHAAVREVEPDARYLAWLGQLQWVERFPERREELVVRADVQLANDPLLALEQFPVGGAYSVRGYRENQLVRDQGLVASVEYRWPLVHSVESGHRLQFAAFYDYGRSWNRERDTPGLRRISSVGIGIRGTYGNWLEYQLYAGVPLHDAGNPDDDLQDDGIHFRVRARVW